MISALLLLKILSFTLAPALLGAMEILRVMRLKKKNVQGHIESPPTEGLGSSRFPTRSVARVRKIPQGEALQGHRDSPPHLNTRKVSSDLQEEAPRDGVSKDGQKRSVAYLPAMA